MISKMTAGTLGFYFLASLCIIQQITLRCDAAPELIKEFGYDLSDQSLSMNMSSSNDITATARLNREALPTIGADIIAVKFQTRTISPQFNILSLDPTSIRAIIDRKSLEQANFVMNMRLRLHANYIGHAILEPVAVEFISKLTRKTSVIVLDNAKYRLTVKIIQDEGIWGRIFIVSVIILMIISYVNLGAQLDEENMRQVIKKPLTLFSGFLISVFVMPAASWFIGKWFYRHQTLFRIGSFVFACGPAASASSLWTVMLNSDKELSVGLQVLSNLGALVTMPLFLYFMERSMKSETNDHHITVVPYSRLIQALLVLLLALIVGWRFVGRNEQAQKVSHKIFRPLVFFVLIFIIIFSSILYWHIYQMFDHRIILVSLMITLATYILSALIGYAVSFDVNKAVAITIGSAYKNSGITFAILLVAYGPPDTYIAYVPCLAQIIITSFSLYIVYGVLALIGCLSRRGQPDVIQATEAGEGSNDSSRRKRNSSKDASDRTGGDTKAEEDDEFIAMNVTDVEADTSNDNQIRTSVNA